MTMRTSIIDFTSFEMYLVHICTLDFVQSNILQISIKKIKTYTYMFIRKSSVRDHRNECNDVVVALYELPTEGRAHHITKYALLIQHDSVLFFPNQCSNQI